MPDDPGIRRARAVGVAFAPRALRTDRAERRLLEELTERVLALHPAWPWPLIEAEAHQRATALLAAGRHPGAVPTRAGFGPDVPPAT